MNTTRAFRAAALAAAAIFTVTAAADAAPMNPKPGAQVRVERVNGSHAMRVVGPEASAGLRVRIATPADGTTTVHVRVRRNGKVVRNAHHQLVIDGAQAKLNLPIATTKTGTYRVAVRLQGRIIGRVVEFDVLPRSLRAGAKGVAVRTLQRALTRRNYVVGQAGVLDARTARAVLAFRKRLRMPRTSAYTEDVAKRLARGEGGWKVRYPGHGRHIESDLSLQLVALIGPGGNVERIYPTSTGKASTPTIRGSFRVYRKDYGTNSLGMVHSAYFIRGYAIHGYKDVPVYPASHGCLRVPVPDALSIYNWINHGTIVDVYAS